MSEDRGKQFQKRMEGFPCHFDLDIKFGFTTANRKNIIRKLSEELETTGFELEAEWTRAFNVLSFLHWRSDDYKSARKYSEQSLSKRQDDVMALANQAWMHWNRSEVSEAQCILEKLEQLKERRELIVISKAEQAFAYTRFGPRYYEKAIELFQDVIASATELKLEETYINLWKFGLGLSLKRQLNFVNAFSFHHLSTPIDSFRHAISVLLDVAQNADTPRYKARSWVSLGELAISIHKHGMLSPQDREEFPKEFKTPDELFVKAVNICDNDVYVLERCGRQARYSKDYDRSIELLRRSIEIRGTSLSHHHLAKAIRSTLNKELHDTMKNSRNQSKTNGPFFYTPVKSGCEGGYNKFLKIQNARRNLFPDYEQTMEDLEKDKILGNRRAFQNNQPSKSSTQHSAAPNTTSIKCTRSIQNDSGIFSLKTIDSLTDKFASVTMSDSTPSACLEAKEHYEPQRQTSNTFSAGHQTSAVETECMNVNRNCNPAAVGGQIGKGYTTYGRCNSENSFSHFSYQKTLACQRGGKNVTQGIRFGDRRGTYQEWDRRQSSEPLLQRFNSSQESAFKRQQSIVNLRIRSPQNVQRYPPNDKRVEEIRKHLEQSLICAPSNYAAQYDKGLLFRSLGLPQDAIELFRKIRSEKKCSPWQAVLCMEQHALCLQEIADTETEPHKKELMSIDIKDLLFKAMEQAAIIATRVPFYKPRGTAFPSLKEMLLRQTKLKKYYDRDDLKNFAQLYELIGKYGSALSFWKEISKMSEKDCKDPEILMKMAQNYVKQRDFRNSLLFFDLIEASCARLAGDNRKLYFEAYLEGALCSLEQDDIKEATSRFKRTVRFCSHRQIISEDEDEDCPYDIHIQTSDAAEESGWRLFDLLTTTCGLKVSLNDNQATEELKYVAKYQGIGDIMEQSCLIIFIFDDASLQNEELRVFINMAVELNMPKNLGTGIISICLEKFNVPREIKSFPVFIQPQRLNFPENENETYQWLREFFWKAAEQTFPPSIPKETVKTDSD